MSDHSRARVHKLLRQTSRLSIRVTLWMEIVMADIAALNAKIAELNQAVLDDEAADDKNEADLNAVIVDLKAQLAAGTPIDTQPFIDALEAIKGNLHAPIVPPAPAP